ncbi:MAG: hypothetical protein ABSA52_13230 [Candidatus Binatia bacterium]
MGIPMGAKIAIDRERIAALCRRHHIRRLALSLSGSRPRQVLAAAAPIGV